MRQNRAPRHDLTHPSIFVPSADSAWRHDLVNREVEQLRRAWDEQQERRRAAAVAAGEAPPEQRPFAEDEHHPFWAYFYGRTRYWIDDPELAPYLDQEARPEMWRIRRLSFEQRRHVEWLQRRDQREEAYWYAFWNGVVALEGVEGDEAGEALAKAIAGLPKVRQNKHLDGLKEAVAGYAIGVVADVGAAVISASADLTEAEGKPFASPRGA